MKFGDFSNICLGSTGLTRVYLGADLVWPKAAKKIEDYSEIVSDGKYILVWKDSNSYVKNYILNSLNTVNSELGIGNTEIFEDANGEFAVVKDDALVLSFEDISLSSLNIPVAYAKIESGCVDYNGVSHDNVYFRRGRQIGILYDCPIYAPFYTDSKDLTMTFNRVNNRVYFQYVFYKPDTSPQVLIPYNLYYDETFGVHFSNREPMYFSLYKF